jgi:hypothetical protein
MTQAQHDQAVRALSAMILTWLQRRRDLEQSGVRYSRDQHDDALGDIEGEPR